MEKEPNEKNQTSVTPYFELYQTGREHIQRYGRERKTGGCHSLFLPMHHGSWVQSKVTIGLCRYKGSTRVNDVFTDRD